MSTESNRVVNDEVDSNAPASEQGANQSNPAPQPPENEARNVFFGMMNQWFTDFIRANPVNLQPPPPVVPTPVPPGPPPSNPNIKRVHRPPVDKIRKRGAEEF